MAMNDEETVALIAGGHTFGKTHGAADPSKYVGPEPEGAPIEEQGLGWKNKFGTGKGDDAIGSGLEVTWTTTPTKWSNNFFENLFSYEWELTKSPAGAHQWKPEEWRRRRHGAGCPRSIKAARAIHADHGPFLALRPAYAKISSASTSIRNQFADAFAKAWFKLTHRDMGPISRYLGPLVPKEPQFWQDPVPAVDHQLIGEQDIAALKAKILASGLSISATGHDSLGVGGDLPRLRQARWRERRAHSPCAAKGLGSEPAGRTGEDSPEAGGDPKGVQQLAIRAGKKVSLADLIVLGGCAAVEEAAKKAGHKVKVPFSPGRTDASQEQTDVHSFAVLEPAADGIP